MLLHRATLNVCMCYTSRDEITHGIKAIARGVEQNQISPKLIILVLMSFLFVVFVILSFAPGDVVKSILGDEATAEQIAELKHELNLDQPLLIRYVRYMFDA